MAVLKPVITTAITILIFISLSSVMTSCTKTVNEHDTTYKTVIDTIIHKDTVYDLKDGLIAYYNFLNGNLNDSSGHYNNINFNNATLTTDRFGHPNSAYHFNSGNYMVVPNSPSLNPTRISLMVIVKFNGYYTGSGQGTEIFMKGPSDQSQGVYGIRSHPISSDYSVPIDTATEMFTPFYGDNAIAIWSVNDFIKSGTWYTVVYTYDGSLTKIYIDGVLKNTLSQTISFNPNTNDIYIGKTENPSFPYYFTGDIDEIRIYNKPLSEQLVKQFSKLTY